MKKIRSYKQNIYQISLAGILISFLLMGLKINNLFTWKQFSNRGTIEYPQLIKQTTWIKSKKALPQENRPVITEYTNLNITYKKLEPLTNQFEEKLIFKSVPLSTPTKLEFPDFSYKDNHTENIRYVDKAHGLFSNSIMSILEDEKGYIWIASEIDGLLKTNGDYCWNFKKSNGLKSNSIIRLFLDSKNRKWICWDKGVSYLSNNRLYHIANKTLSNSTLSRIREDKNGDIWFGTEENGLFKMSNNKLECFNKKRGLASNNISDVAFDDSNIIYVTNVDKGLNIINGNSIQQIKDKDSPIFEFSPISMLMVKDKLWIGSFAGSQFYWKNNKMYKVKFKKSFERCFEMIENEFGIWFADYSSGMQLLKKDGTIHSYEKAHGLVDRNAFSFIIDRNKNIWVADPFFGFSMITISPFRAKKELGNYIVKMISSTSGDRLLAHNGLGVSRVKKNDFELINIRQGKGIFTVDHSWDIMEDVDASFWVSTHGMGIAKMNDKNFNISQFKSGQTITDIEKGTNNDFWFSTNESGIRQWSFEKKQFKLYGVKDGLSSNNVRSSTLDHLNRLWICTDKGIDILWRNKVAHINKKQGLASDEINNIAEDSQGRYWISTNDAGVNLISGNEILHFNQANGLINDRVISVYCGSEKETWIITTSGLTRLTEIGPLKFKKESFGLNLGGFMLDFTGGTFKEENGKILFFTSQGYIEYDPYFLLSKKPSVLWNIEKIIINDKKEVPVTYKLHLLKNESIVVESSLLNWGFKNSSNYYFAVVEDKSLDTNWIQTEVNEKIKLDTKFTGEYQLFYRVNTNGRKLIFSGPNLIIENPWYQTRMFYLLCLILVILLIYALFKWRLNSIQKKKLLLESIVLQRTDELQIEKNELAIAYQAIENQSNEKDVIIYEIHHRVKNNLQIITSLLDMQMRRISNKESVSILQDTIRRISAMSTSHNLLYASDDFSRINLSKFLQELISSHEIFMFDNSSKINIDYEIDDFSLTMTDCISLGMIVSEVISNSIKHAFENIENPTIKITAVYENSNCVLTISDNGVGIGDEYLNGSSGGLGLRLIRIFATKLKGTIEILKLNQGTSVTVSFKCE